jgi:S-adenosylmethionine synthetase
MYASRIVERLSILRKSNEVSWLRPDCKALVTMKYRRDGCDIKPVEVTHVSLLVQHSPDVLKEEIESFISNEVSIY